MLPFLAQILMHRFLPVIFCSSLIPIVYVYSYLLSAIDWYLRRSK